MLKTKFDDFETQRQSDEYVWFDDFDTQRQVDEWPEAPEEINLEEYDDWVAWCVMGMYAND